MSLKNRDGHNRWKNKTVAFRVSPEENELIKKPLHCLDFQNRNTATEDV